MRIAVDAMGGDYAPLEIVKGALTAVETVPELEVVLVGHAEQIERLSGAALNSPRVKIVHAEEVIGNKEDPGMAIRSKKKASMVVAMQLVRQGEADAVVSCGSTGALMAGGVLFLGRIPGIKRPALLTVMPPLRGARTVILDVGANMDARPEQMLQYALMGSIYAREILGKTSPRVALLNVGVEENKGNQQVKHVYGLFQQKVNGFVGNLEAKDIFDNRADVLVCDGFAGNVMLKAMEGISKELLLFLSAKIREDAEARTALPLLSPLLQRVRADLDEAEYGGALLMGVNGVCIKCHGASQEQTVAQTLIRQALPLVQREINKKIDLALSGGWCKEDAGDER